MSSSRLEKLKKANMTSDKSYPPFISYIYTKVTRINEIPFDTIKDDVTRLKLKTGIKSPPVVFVNKKTKQYYHRMFGSDNVDEITDEYDWDKVLKKGVYPFEEFRIKEGNHQVVTEEERIFYPGSPQYDAKYPPIN